MVKPENYQEVSTPCYIIDEKLLRHNLEILRHVCDETGCKILLAQKAFSMYYEYPLIGRYLNGATASGLYEAKLAYEELCCREITDITGSTKHCENHIFSPAYPEKDIGYVTIWYLIPLHSGRSIRIRHWQQEKNVGFVLTRNIPHRIMQFMIPVRPDQDWV